jgi:bis(5'-adenosyl)-triphosphatase
MLRERGADVLLVPAAFTIPTGMAHWTTLLRARAMFLALLHSSIDLSLRENQCYVIAAAQEGIHNSKRQSYGHSCIIDPWGIVIAETSQGPGVAIAVCVDLNLFESEQEIDLERVAKIRESMPVFSHTSQIRLKFPSDFLGRDLVSSI